MTAESQSSFWVNLFKRRPDLKPPGYEETVRAMGYETKPPLVASTEDECSIEF
ncbi:hypothetical protein SynSYN20_01576 [Synechococcus sp. SYN20]|uniref:hypothetical protein n=1 Tax=Synechococcus sp. SYN20 TaxID=1050714 RepID=UPI00164949B4|nr:hypothetical protein [Synechococcus sp. SYN20]QNJ25903.1 hypothetical protein SynSYN20_01576 [Synechococcus sp. SYN20]